MVVEGQVHGGIAQGVGQAMLENCVYDMESGQLLTGSYMDYCMPRAGDLPSFRIGLTETPCTRSEEHTSELQSLMRNSYAVIRLKKKNTHASIQTHYLHRN